MVAMSSFGKIWRGLSHALQVRDLVVLFGGTSLAAAVARSAISHQAELIVVLFESVAAFAAGGLIAAGLVAGWPKFLYWLRPPTTTLELHGRMNLTLEVKHKGLPVKVWVRLQLIEVGDQLQPYFEPFDVHLQTTTHGGTHKTVEMSDEVNVAWAALATLRKLDRDASQLTIELPRDDNVVVVQGTDFAALVMWIRRYISSPVGVAEIARIGSVEHSVEQIRFSSPPAIAISSRAFSMNA
jgi:hypothetical protein